MNISSRSTELDAVAPAARYASLTGTHEPGRGSHALQVFDETGCSAWRDGPLTLLAASFDLAGTEILASDLRSRGLDAVAGLQGRFALLFWDAERREGILATDRLGTRSVFFAARGDGLAFGLELVHLSQLGTPLTPDTDAVSRWLVSGTLERSQTLFERVQRLPAGHALVFGGSSPWRIVEYWSPTPHEVFRHSKDELRERTREAIVQAVRSRVRPGSTGILLSGGLDSGTVAAAARIANPDPHAFRLYSLCFPEEPSADESSYIADVRQRMGAPAGGIDFLRGSAILDGLRYIERYRLPPAATTLFFNLPLLRVASADGSTVLLDGNGGDELFGCDIYLLADLIGRGRFRSARRLLGRVPELPVPFSSRMAARALWTFGIRPSVPAAAVALARRLRQRKGPPLLRPEARRRYLDGFDPWGWTANDGPRWWAEKAHRLTVAPDELGVFDFLRHKASMAGLTAAHPLLDDADLVEFSLRLPPESSFDPALSRPLERDAMKGLLPDSVRLRPDKTRFNAVLADAMTGCDWPVARQLLAEGLPEVAAYVDERFLRERILSSPSRDMRWCFQIWRLVMVEVWLRALQDEKFPSRLRESTLLAPVEYVGHPAA